RAGRESQADAVVWEGVDEVGEETGRDCNGALFLDGSLNPAAHRDLEVGGSELQAVLVGGDENIRRDGQGAAGSDGAADDAEAASEGFLGAGYLHICIPI